MNADKSLEKLIKKDCRKAMFSTVILYTIGDLLGSLLLVYTAGVLGNFADAVLNLDFQNGLANLWVLLGCLLANLIVVPLINMGGEVIMFANSLRHGRSCTGRFLDKTYGDALSIDAGEAQFRIEEDPIDLRCNWVTLMEKLILTPITLIYLLSSTLKISPLFTAVVFALSVIKLIVPMAIKKKQAKFDLQNREYNSTVRSYETKITEKPHMILLYGIKRAMLERMDELYRTYYRKTVKKSSRYNTVSNNILSVLDTCCVLLILFFGSLLVSQGKITAGSVAAMAGYFAVYNMIIENMDNIIRTLPLLRNNISRIKVLYRHAEKDSGENAADMDNIEAKDLAFQYGDRPVLRGINFSIKKGDKVAVTGANGSGKSTLIFILCGLFENYEGSVKINGRELKELNPKTWRSFFAFVQQDPYLFEGSVVENIRLGNLSARDDEVLQVMERLNIAYLADRTVSYHEKSLSGGEKQRISLARALLKGNNLLIFDEPNNNLDAETRKWIGDFIQDCKETVIFICHDEMLKNKADKVISLS